jgi:AraC-like DNA-binding protein
MSSLSPRRFSAAAAYDTLRLYLHLQNITTTAEQLNVSESTVANRLKRLGVAPRPRGHKAKRAEEVNDPRFLQRLLEQLRMEAQAEQPFNAELLSAAMDLRVIELYFELHSTAKVGRLVGLSAPSVTLRLHERGINLRPRGRNSINPASINDMAYVRRLIVLLRARTQPALRQAS